MGKFNSSATRVAPFFQALIDRDRSGKTWLSSILKLLPNRHSFTPELVLEPGEITKSQFGKSELCLNPPLRFLKWMVEHPHELNWPKYETQPHRSSTTRSGECPTRCVMLSMLGDSLPKILKANRRVQQVHGRGL